MFHKLLLLLCLAYTGIGFAQFTTSPFSRAGLGEPGGYTDPIFGAVGNASSAVMDSTVVNTYNPSSYALLAKGQPLFSTGLSGRASTYTENGTTVRNGLFNLNQLALAIPANKYIGLAFGLQPFSRKGYNITDAQAVGDDTVYYSYQGSGTINQVFGGLGVQFLQTKRHSLGLGANYAFLFGTVTDERYSYTISTSGQGGGVSNISYRLHSGYYTLGLNYNVKLDFEGNKQLKIGATFAPEQRLSANRDHYIFFSDTAVFNKQTYSVLYSSLDDKGSIIQPSSMSVGFAYMFRPRSGADYKLKSIYQFTVYGDISSTNWKSYATDFRDEQAASPYENTQRFSLGVQFTPNFNAYDRTVGKSYFNRIRYRVGASFGTMPYVEAGKQLKESAVTAGLGLPMSSQRTNSSLNISVQYGNRGAGSSNGLNEQFLNFSVGVIIAPAFYDKWFRKTKLD